MNIVSEFLYLRSPSLVVAWFVVILFFGGSSAVLGQAESRQALTPLQSAIQQQQERLHTGDVEHRRDALMRLAALRHPDASRVAAPALADVSPTVRVAAATALTSLPAGEAVQLLIPVLKDKVEFVRQEVAYAMGKTGSKLAVAPLLELISTEKAPGVRAAAVVSLGLIGDETSVVPLAQLLAPALNGSSKSRVEKNEFVLRAAARSLGQIRSRAAVPSLIAALEKTDNPADVRREAAIALGRIGAAESVSALRNVLTSDDPYLAAAASESLKHIASR
jgi:HEAT repeat protein